MLLGIIGIFGLLVSIGIVLQYFTFFNRFEQIAFISYLLLPLAAIGLDLYRYRLLFTVFAIVISSLLLYFSYEFNSREYRSELEKSLADALERVSPGNEIDFAEDYDTAISRIRETHYDIAFCDIQMPGKNGLDLTGSIKRMSPRTNIIIVTAYSEYALDAFKLFVSGYILKPVKDADLAAALDNLRIAPAPPPEKKLDIRCFGNFEVFIDGKPMYFHRKRSKEILAYLVCLRGASAGRDEICGNIFEYQEATDKMIANFKIIVHTLKKDLEKHGVGEFLIHSQNRYSIDTDLVTCDYFDYLTGRSTAQNTYHGEFMTQYSWAEQFIYMLDSIRGEGYGE